MISKFALASQVALTANVPPEEDQSKFESDIEMGVVMNLISLPSSMRGASVFDIPNLKASFEMTQTEGNALQVVLRGTDNRDVTSKKYQVELEKAAIQVKSFFPTSFWLEVGLIANPWNEVSEELWDFQFWGAASFSALRRYKYLAASELGVNAHWNISDLLGLSLSVTNGESAQESEKGARKDSQLILWYEDETWQVSLGYLLGAYDEYEPAVNAKERILARVAYVWEPVLATLEVFKTKDPSEAINKLDLAENLDLTSLVNQSVSGEGGSMTLRWNYNENYTLRLRSDLINPSVTLQQREIKTNMLAVTYEKTRGTNLSCIYARTDLGEQHSSAAKTSEKVILALGMHF